MEQEVFYCPICKLATRHILLNMKSQMATSLKNQRCESLFGKGFKLFLQTTAVASDLVGLTKIGRSLSNHNPYKCTKCGHAGYFTPDGKYEEPVEW